MPTYFYTGASWPTGRITRSDLTVRQAAMTVYDSSPVMRVITAAAYLADKDFTLAMLDGQFRSVYLWNDVSRSVLSVSPQIFHRLLSEGWVTEIQPSPDGLNKDTDRAFELAVDGWL